ncbi:MAG: hypothetical protein ACLSGS_09735 [Adlercreutzia sp.]
MAIEPGASIEGELDVPADLMILLRAFPDHPVLPGVIIMERSPNALPSRCCNRPSCAAASAFFTGIDAAKFRRQVALATRDAAARPS